MIVSMTSREVFFYWGPKAILFWQDTCGSAEFIRLGNMLLRRLVVQALYCSAY